MHKRRLLFYFVLFLLCSCRAKATSETTIAPVPTVAAIFSTQTDHLLVATPTSDPKSALLESALRTNGELAALQGADTESDIRPTDETMPYRELMIYDEVLSGNWLLNQSSGMSYNIADETQREVMLDQTMALNTGSHTLRVTPEEDFGLLFFTVPPTTTITYLRDEVLGVSFWLGSGDVAIAPEDLAVSMRGSNTLPYWTPQDDEEFQRTTQDFSETRLYFLDLNRSIPPHTWVQITVMLDNLLFDPDYNYVTGFYIKNDAGIRTTFYVDKVALLLAP